MIFALIQNRNYIAFHKKSKKLLYINQKQKFPKNFFSLTKKEISRITLYLPKTDISKKWIALFFPKKVLCWLLTQT